MKSPWEARVGVLLDPRLHPMFTYSYKPYDSGHYGGQPRIDWHAADVYGRYWMIEVKTAALNRRSINLDLDVTPGQIAGLTDIARTACGVALLAVGQGKTLYVFNWRRFVFPTLPTGSRIELLSADFHLNWSPKAWRVFDFHAEMCKAGAVPVWVSGMMIGTTPPSALVSSVGVPAELVGPSWVVGSGTIQTASGEPLPIPPPPLSPSTSKPPDSIRTRRRKLLSALSSAKRPG